MKTVNITDELFRDIVEYFYSNDNGLRDYLAEKIRRQVSDKVDKLVARELFSEYKRARTPEEREKARRAYLAERGISEKFISSSEERYLPE